MTTKLRAGQRMSRNSIRMSINIIGLCSQFLRVTIGASHHFTPECDPAGFGVNEHILVYWVPPQSPHVCLNLYFCLKGQLEALNRWQVLLLQAVRHRRLRVVLSRFPLLGCRCQAVCPNGRSCRTQSSIATLWRNWEELSL